ncbi:MAG: hypothetical protein ACR2KZ_12240 [Segetibacter sp.]
MLTMNFPGAVRIRAVRNKPMPEIEHPQDAIVQVTRSCICGSDLGSKLGVCVTAAMVLYLKQKIKKEIRKTR